MYSNHSGGTATTTGMLRQNNRIFERKSKLFGPSSSLSSTRTNIFGRDGGSGEEDSFQTRVVDGPGGRQILEEKQYDNTITRDMIVELPDDPDNTIDDSQLVDKRRNPRSDNSKLQDCCNPRYPDNSKLPMAVAIIFICVLTLFFPLLNAIGMIAQSDSKLWLAPLFGIPMIFFTLLYLCGGPACSLCPALFSLSLFYWFGSLKVAGSLSWDWWVVLFPLFFFLACLVLGCIGFMCCMEKRYIEASNRPNNKPKRDQGSVTKIPRDNWAGKPGKRGGRGRGSNRGNWLNNNPLPKRKLHQDYDADNRGGSDYAVVQSTEERSFDDKKDEGRTNYDNKEPYVVSLNDSNGSLEEDPSKSGEGERSEN